MTRQHIDLNAPVELDVELDYVEDGVRWKLSGDLVSIDGQLRLVSGDGVVVTLVMTRAYAEKLAAMLQDVLKQ